MNKYTLPSGLASVEKIDGGFEGDMPVTGSKRNDALMEAMGELYKLQAENARLKKERDKRDLEQQAKGIEDAIEWLATNYPQLCNPCVGLLSYFVSGQAKRMSSQPNVVESKARQDAKLREGIKQILGWRRELRGTNNFPVERVEELCRRHCK